METTVNNIIKTLQLEKHCEGGYFRQTFCADHKCLSQSNKKRPALTSIYYLITNETKVSYFAVNQSDLMIYHHFGDPLKIIFIHENGETTEEIVGPDIAAGQKPQLICPANIWKAYDLMSGEYALIGEAVAPGFDYADMIMPTHDDLKKRSPQHFERLRYLVYPS